MYGYIYKTTCVINNKVYIGQHKATKFTPSYKGGGLLIKEAVKKYGTDNFTVELIDTAESKNELNDKEIYYIEKFDARNSLVGYNLAEGGNYWSCDYHMGMRGKHQSDKQKRIAHDYMVGRCITAETRQKMSVSARARTANRKTINGKVFVHKDNYQTCVDRNQLSGYLANGFVKGKIPASEQHKVIVKKKYAESVYVKRGARCVLIQKQELDDYIKNGWIVGRNCYSEGRGANISKSKRGKICINNASVNRYVAPEDLASYLAQGWVKGNKVNSLRTKNTQ